MDTSIEKAGIQDFDCDCTILKSGETEPSAALAPWDRRANEPLVWYERFLTFLRLGSERTLAQAHKKLRNPVRYGWLVSRARKDHWWERAEAWDAEQEKKQ